MILQTIIQTYPYSYLRLTFSNRSNHISIQITLSCHFYKR